MKTSVSREYRNSSCDINGGMLNSLLVCSLLVALSVALEVGKYSLVPMCSDLLLQLLVLHFVS